MGALVSKEKENDLKRQFAQIDKNHDGLISKYELYTFFKRQDNSITEDQIKLFVSLKFFSFLLILPK